jgi:hypothetical protein
VKMWRPLVLCLLLAALWAADLWTPSAAASGVCSFYICTGTGPCTCPGIRQPGHCVDGFCMSP